ncbi:MAG: hypothetical protein ACFB10_10250 [Salibacteraceae bacterium]
MKLQEPQASASKTTEANEAEAPTNQDFIVETSERVGSIHISANMLEPGTTLQVSDPDTGVVFFDSDQDAVDPFIGLEVPFEIGETQQLKVSAEGGLLSSEVLARFRTEMRKTGWVVDPWRRKRDLSALIALTQLRADFRGATLANFGSTVGCDTVPDGVAYEFLFEAPGGFATTTQTTSLAGDTSLDYVLDLIPNEQYSVRVKAKVGDHWGNYGPAYTITTPNLANTTWLRDDFRNQEVGMRLNMYANGVSGVSQYRWKVLRIEDGFEEIINRSNTQFAPNFLVNERYSTTYYLRASVNLGGSWTDYGPARMYRTEPFPDSFLVDAYVGYHEDQNGYIYRNNVTSVTSSRWEFVATDGTFTKVHQYNSGSTRLHKAWPRLPFDKTYTVRIQALVGGVWGPFGSPRTITYGPIPKTTIWDQYVGLLPDQGVYINAYNVPGTADYEWLFEATDGSHTVSRERNSTSYNFSPGWMRLHMGKTYDVRIRVQDNSLAWGEWGDPRQITIGVVTTELDARWTTSGDGLTRQSTYVTCRYVAGATNYFWQFDATDNSHTASRLRNAASYNFSPSWLRLHYGKTYDVRVKIENAGVLGDFGPTQQIYIPFEYAKLRDSHAGLQPNQSRYISADPAYGTENNEWRFTAHDGTHTVDRLRNSTSQNFSISWLRLHYGKTYDVEIRVFNGGVWHDWGPKVEIIVPFEYAELRADLVGITIPTTGAYLYSQPISSVDASEWEISSTDGTHTWTYTRNYHIVYIHTGNNLLPGKTYNVRIKVLNGGAWGDWGPVRQLDVAPA